VADFGLVEGPEPGYAACRRRNLAACDAALLFGFASSPGSCGLIKDRRKLGELWGHVEPGVTRLTPGCLPRTGK
jgi:hypothetical protein